MKIHHIRNATALLTLGQHRLLIDPMFAKVGSMPGFKMFGGGRRRNPLVPLPEGAMEIMSQATGILVTHEHPDHFDPGALAWAKRQGLPVWAGAVDAPNLKRKGLDARELTNGALEGVASEVLLASHGRGLVGWLMGPVSGFYLAVDGEPSLYITGDTVLTKSVLDDIERLKPDVILAPAGSANFGLGRSIIFDLDELMALTRVAPGQVVFNHMEALDHCGTTRNILSERMEKEGLLEKVHIPADGQAITLPGARQRGHVAPGRGVPNKPGLQKWVTARFAGT